MASARPAPSHDQRIANERPLYSQVRRSFSKKHSERQRACHPGLLLQGVAGSLEVSTSGSESSGSRPTRVRIGSKPPMNQAGRKIR